MRWSEPGIARSTAVIFALALAAHLAVGMTLDRNPLAETLISDALSYDAWARRLAAGGFAAEPVFHQAPLYPAALSLFYDGRSAPGPPVSVLVLQAVGTAFAIAALVPIGARFLRSARAGVIAASVALLFGPFVFYAFKLLPVALTLATQAVVLWLVAVVRDRPSRGFAMALGAACGLAALARAEFALFAPVAAACAIGRSPARWHRGAAWAVGFAVALAPATVHNLRQGDRVLIASAGGENLFAGNQPWGDGGHAAIDPRAGDLFSARVLAQEIAERDAGRPLRPSEISAYWRGRALRTILEDPAGWLRLEGRKLSRIVHLGDPNDMYSLALERERFHPGLYALFVPAGPVVLLGAVGLGIALATRRRDAWPLVAFVGVQGLVLLAFFVNSRLRLPLMYGLAPFAGLAVESGVRAWTAPRRRALVAAAASATRAVGIASVVLTRPAPRDRVRLAAVLSTRGELTEALEVLAPAIAEPRPDALALDQAGWVLHKGGRSAEAVERYRRAIEVGLPEGRETQTLTRLAQVLEDSGAVAEAATWHDRAIASEGANAGTWFERGAYRTRRGDLTGAVSDFERAASLDPGWSAPREALRRLEAGR